MPAQVPSTCRKHSVNGEEEGGSPGNQEQSGYCCSHIQEQETVGRRRAWADPLLGCPGTCLPGLTQQKGPTGTLGQGGGDVGCLASGSSGQPWAATREPSLSAAAGQVEGLGVLCLSSHLQEKQKARRPLGFRRQKQKPWDGQGQTQADNEVTPFPDRNFFPKLQHCWLSASLSSCLICDPGSTLSSGTGQSPQGKLQPPLPPPLLSILFHNSVISGVT